MANTVSLSIEDALDKLVADKKAELKALAQQCLASEQRLAQAHTDETAAHTDLRLVIAELEQARKDLTAAKQEAAKLRSDGKGAADRALAEAYKREADFVAEQHKALNEVAANITRWTKP